ncbi:MAG: response regulator [Deltaproteobacteria bacterium]|nr:response regulator [Deltaproteobacteria bacterium]
MNSYRILVVEDEAIVAMDIEARLAAMGYDLAGRGSSGEQALALTAEKRPDLVLMDIRLQGGMDGIVAAEEIRRGFHIPVIFLTAYSEDDTLERAKLAEPFGYILKPFDDRELKSAIEIALYRHQMEKELLRMNRLYDVLSHVNQAIVRLRSQDELLPAICRLVVEHGGLDLAWIGWLDAATSRIHSLAHAGNRCEILDKAEFIAGQWEEGYGDPGRAIREGKPFVCNECDSGRCLYPDGMSPARFGFQSCASFPLRFQGRLTGVLNLCVTAPGFFQKKEIDLLEEVAFDISFALDMLEDDRQRRRLEEERKLTSEVLGLINNARDRGELLKAVLPRLKRWSGCEAAGIRLRDGDDFPYYETSGFPERFVRLERSLCSLDARGEVLRDAGGKPVLDCMCGNVIQGRVDPAKSFFTTDGSFWSNCTTELLAATSEADRQSRTRNRCNGEGYESVALIPLRSGNETFGLIQLNDKRKGQFTLEKITLFERLAAQVANFLAKIQMQEKLKESETQLRSIGDNLPNGYVYQYTHGPDGKPKFLYVSAGAARVHGVSPEAAVRDATFLLRQIDPEQVEEFRQAEESSAAGLTDFSMDLHMRRPDGNWRWLQACARPRKKPDGQIIWDGLVIDISERREAETQLRKLSAAVEQSPVAVVITDLLGNIEYVNPEFTRISGYTREDALGRNPRILQAGETPVEVYRDLWETITAGREWRGVFHNRRKDGTLFWERASISSIRDAAGTITHFIAVKEDITAQKSLEEQFHQAQKMEFIGRLAGGVAHDFNNMLMVISGHTELVMEQTGQDSPVYRDLQEIKRAAKRSEGLTRQLLAFARKQTINPVMLNLNDTLTGMLKMLQRLIGEDIELSWLPGRELWSVKIDPSQIDQLLANLAVNARDAIAGNGKVTIETGNTVLNEQLDDLHCAGQQECVAGQYIMLAVSDTGCGMTREVLDHIFEPFFTTKEKGKGTGLGLATVYGIVKQNNGFITVCSEPGQGTRFRIYLPRYDAQAMDVQPEIMTETPPRGTETVLIVEDEKAILDLGRRILERLGYRVLTADTPEEAIRMAKEYAGPIHLLITDVVMPQMNGKELAERLKTIIPGLKCLYMSGYTANVIARHGILDKGVIFLQKPFSAKETAIKVRQALEQNS